MKIKQHKPPIKVYFNGKFVADSDTSILIEGQWFFNNLDSGLITNDDIRLNDSMAEVSVQRPLF